MSQESFIRVRIGTCHYVRYKCVAGEHSLAMITIRLNGKRLFRRIVQAGGGNLYAVRVIRRCQSTSVFTLGSMKTEASTSIRLGGVAETGPVHEGRIASDGASTSRYGNTES